MQIPREIIIRFLRRIELLQDLSDEDIEHLIPHLELMSVDEGGLLFEEGAKGAAWYIVLEGAVSIRRSLQSGELHELALLQAGEGFGEMSLLDGAPRMAAAEIAEDAMLARLSRATFDRLLDQEPALGVRLLRSMSRVICKRQRELTFILQDLVDFKQEEGEEAGLGAVLMRHVTWN